MASSAEADADLPPWVAAPTTPYHTLEHYKDGQLLDATTLKERVTTVGRDASATLALLHPTVSRKHGALVHDGDRGLFLVGFESQYGSTVDGVRCAPGTPTRLRDGATQGRKIPTSKAPSSVVFHSFRLIFGRAIVSRDGLEAWMLVPARARRKHSR